MRMRNICENTNTNTFYKYILYLLELVVTIFWIIYSLIALINNPNSLLKKTCPKTSIYYLLVLQIIITCVIIIERLRHHFYKKTKAHVTCILVSCIVCILVWSIGALFNTCAKSNLTLFDVYTMALMWFITTVTIIVMEILKLKFCPSNKNNIIPSKNINNTFDEIQNPLENVKYPVEKVDYAEL